MYFKESFYGSLREHLITREQILVEYVYHGSNVRVFPSNCMSLNFSALSEAEYSELVGHCNQGKRQTTYQRTIR